MIAAAKLIASQGEKLVKFARILAKYCKDKRLVSRPCDFYCSVELYEPTETGIILFLCLPVNA